MFSPETAVYRAVGRARKALGWKEPAALFTWCSRFGAVKELTVDSTATSKLHCKSDRYLDYGQIEYPNRGMSLRAAPAHDFAKAGHTSGRGLP